MRIGPFLITGVVLLLYWGQVLRMARRAKRRTGRAANFVPTECLGWWLRWVWQPVVWTWIAVPWVLTFDRHPVLWPLRPLYQLPLLQWGGAGGVCVMWFATLPCWRQMGIHWRMGIDPAETTRLQVNGPFAYVRHPIYALSQVMAVCSFLAAPAPLMGCCCVIHVVLLHWEALREERYLLKVHGAAFEQYRAVVGRFVPRLRRGYVPAPS